MSQVLKINAQLREKLGKGSSREARRNGMVPCVIYGDKKAPVSIQVERKELVKLLETGHLFTSICEIKAGKDTFKTLARDVQMDPLKDWPNHADFLRVTDKTRVSANVPLHFINEDAAPGLMHGGILNIVRHDVEISCAATNIPESLEVDLSGAALGDSIKSHSLTLPKGVSFTEDRDFTLATIAAPAALRSEGGEDEADEAEEASDADDSNEE